MNVSWAYVSNLISIRWGNPKLLVLQCRVLKLGSNGGEGKWSKMFPMSLICTIYIWREWKEPRSKSFTWDFWEKRGFSLSFQDFPFRRSLLSEKNFSKYENLNFSLVFSTQSTFSPTSKLFLSSNSMRHTFSPRIAKTHFHPNLMKYFSELIETCFFIILHETFILWGHVLLFFILFFQFLVEISPTTHEFGC